MDKMKKGPTVVIPNEQGGTISLSEEDNTLTASICVAQCNYQLTPEGLLIETRVAELVDTINRVISLNLSPGTKLRGNVIIKQQLTPVSEDDITLYLLKDAEGNTVTTTEGQAVWHYSYYSEIEEDVDDIIVEIFR